MIASKALLSIFLATSSPSGLSSAIDANLTVNDRPSTCKQVEQYEELQEERPLSDEEERELDFFSRACEVQEGAEALGGIVDDYSESVQSLQQSTMELNEYLEAMRRLRDPSAYLCC